MASKKTLANLSSYNLALNHFKKVDPVLYQLALKIPPIVQSSKVSPDQYFDALCETIISQQLSIKAADTIWARILALFPNNKISSHEVIRISDDEFRKCGCSFSKIRYLKNLAAAEIDFSTFPDLSNQEITKILIEVKGIGPWTIEMFLMFVMDRQDIFSNGDLGLKNAVKKHPRLQNPESWSPYRSWASRILWKSLELK
jgi:DNA-3-methyladenine glycosylase II